MSVEKENQKDNLENNIKRLSLTDKNLPKVKKHKKSFKKAGFNKEVKVVPLLKPPSKRRKYDENGNLENEEKIHNKSGIIWDNKTIDEQYLDRKLHPRIKIDEPKTPYPDGDDNDVYQEGMNKLNEIKPTEELLNDVVNSLKENKERKPEYLEPEAHQNPRRVVHSEVNHNGRVRQRREGEKVKHKSHARGQKRQRNNSAREKADYAVFQKV